MPRRSGFWRRAGGWLTLACLLDAAPALATQSLARTSVRTRRLIEFPVRLEPSRLGLPASVTAADLSRELAAAARAWSYPAVPCTSVVFEVGAAEQRRVAAQDGSFRVLFRSQSWCHNERCGHLATYPARTAAMTTLYPESGDGPIVEADIELNGVSFWEGVSPLHPPSARTPSLRGVLVHELGHVLGLGDACPETGPAGAAPGAGCDSAMLSGERVAPSAADVRWLCAAYPRDSRGPRHRGRHERRAGRWGEVARWRDRRLRRIARAGRRQAAKRRSSIPAPANVARRREVATPHGPGLVRLPPAPAVATLPGRWSPTKGCSSLRAPSRRRGGGDSCGSPGGPRRPRASRFANPTRSPAARAATKRRWRRRVAPRRCRWSRSSRTGPGRGRACSSVERRGASERRGPPAAAPPGGRAATRPR